MRYAASIATVFMFFAVTPSDVSTGRRAQVRTFSCETTFRPDATVASLERRFGVQNVKSADIYLGEGFAEPGTVLFPEQPEDRLEITWRDKGQKQSLNWIRLRGTHSHWVTPQGLTLGSDLRGIQRVNRRPFRILSFDVDNPGTVLSWSGGLLERKSPVGCTLVVRLLPKPYFDPGAPPLHWYQDLIGLDAFSSGHPAAQALNPTVYELLLSYGGSFR